MIRTASLQLEEKPQDRRHMTSAGEINVVQSNEADAHCNK